MTGSTGASEFSDCQVSEILVYSGALADSQRVSVETYLKEKYDLWSSATIDYACLGGGGGGGGPDGGLAASGASGGVVYGTLPWPQTTIANPNFQVYIGGGGGGGAGCSASAAGGAGGSNGGGSGGNSGPSGCSGAGGGGGGWSGFQMVNGNGGSVDIAIAGLTLMSIFSL